MICYDLWTMKHKLWIALVTYLAYCIDKELYKAIDYLKSQVGVCRHIKWDRLVV